MACPRTYDVVVVGGGVIGSACAFYLKRLDPALGVAVIERDPTYRRASSALSAGNARIQFALESNVRISQYTFEVLRHFGDEMQVDGIRPDVGFRAEGNLFLVGESGRHAARVSLGRQRRLGCAVDWFDCAEISARWPLLDVAAFAGGTFGPEDGYLDGYSFLMAYRNKAVSLGAAYIEDTVTGLERRQSRIGAVHLASGGLLAADRILCCAGAWARSLLGTAGVSIPVEPVQRQSFLVDTEVKPAGPLPLISLPSGFYLRSEGDDRILVGRSLDDDRVGEGFSWSERRFYDVLWPELVSLVPAFDRLRLARGWTGLYAVNRFDGNAILGSWPGLEGLYLANGFSGHGLQQAPAVGRYLAESILGLEPSLDLTEFGAERLLTGERLREVAFL